jgi:uncharacterized protein YlzI (FlbEa/FlbD family)
MIRLTLGDGAPILLNPRHIKSVESSVGYTLITMTTRGGDEPHEYIVRESLNDVLGLLKQGGRR